jgi:translation initiation factor IF-3
VRRYIIAPKQRINDEIRAREVRLIDEHREQLGIVPISQALALAEERDLDLVEVSPQAEPPVCKLMDFDKIRYERKKQRQEAKKKSRKIEVKEVRLTPNTGDNDIMVKAKQARGFLEGGDKVRVIVRFAGREITHPELGKEILEKTRLELRDIAEVEQKPQFEGKKLSMILTPTTP